MELQAKDTTLNRTAQVNSKVLVLGGGAAGIATAEKLSAAGCPVILAEKSEELGGKFSQLNFLYQSNLSPSTWLDTRIKALQDDTGVELYTRASLREIKGQAGSFKVHLDLNGESLKDEVGAVVVAIGTDEEKRNLFSGEVNAGSLSVQDLEKMMPRFSVGSGSKNFVFIIKEDEFLWSTAALLKNALKLKETGHNIYIFFDDMKVRDAGLEKLYHSCRQQGVTFIRGLENLEAKKEKETFTFKYKDMLLPANIVDKDITITAQYLVVSEKTTPAKDTKKLADLLRLPTGVAGFIQEDNYHLFTISSRRTGIYFVGSCSGTDFLHNIQEQALAAAEEILSLKKNASQDAAEKPYIKPELCAFCLTCYRSCPRSAIEMDYEKEAAFVDPVACQSCGICVAECPNRAIFKPGYTQPDMDSMLDELGFDVKPLYTEPVKEEQNEKIGGSKE